MASPNKPLSVMLGQYLSLVLVLPISTFVGYGLGWLLDKAFGTSWIYIPGLILGAAAGFIDLIRTLLRDTKK